MPPNKTPEPAPPPQDAPQPPPPPPIPVLPSPATEEKLPDPWEQFRRLIFKRFGVWGLSFVALLVLVWSNWSTVKDLPVISSIVTWFSQAPLPKADPQRFAMALAHLEYDKDQQYERLIREVLKDFEGVQLLQFDRIISLAGTEPEEREKKGHTKARQFLQDSGAHVLIWGLVLSQDDKSAPRLYWTTLEDSKRAKEAYQPKNFKLPDLFWDDLAEVLRLVVATESSKFLAQEGRFVADQLAPFITRVRRLLNTNSGQRGWSEVQFVLGNALMIFGEQTETKQPLEEALAAYRIVLMEWTRERVPLDWAGTQTNLGSALLRLGERESGTARLTEAVAAYRAALAEQTRERVPLDWALTQNNLGNALLSLGEREASTARLIEAVAAYRAALTEWTRERIPLRWAATQSGLGFALTRLGEREASRARLTEAVAAYRAALTERTRERVPLEWAATQTNLGLALTRLGERESSTTHLTEAVAAYRAALTEQTRERVPLEWATTQTNLGLALTRLGERESGTARLTEAVAAYHAALTERTRERVPLEWAMTQSGLGLALTSLGERKNDATLLCEALEKQLIAWEVFAIGSPYNATTAANIAKNVLTIQKNAFDIVSYDTCLAKHAEALKRMGLR